MEEVKTYRATDENGYIGFAQDDDHYQREKDDILNAFCKLEISAELGSFDTDTASVLRSLLKNYVGLIDAAHNMTEIDTNIKTKNN